MNMCCHVWHKTPQGSHIGCRCNKDSFSTSPNDHLKLCINQLQYDQT